MRMKPIQMINRRHRRVIRLLAAVLAFSLVWGGNQLGEMSGWGFRSAAQSLQPEFVATEVYKRLPDLPLENQYINQNTGEVESDSTLVSRLIRYHQYVKSRPNGFRLDWKLTLADYLGVHEAVEEARYPGHVNLQTNPYAGDIEAVQSLDLRQRDQLVEALVKIYDPQGVYSLAKPKPSVEETDPPSPTPNRPSVPFPQPGDADLLLP